MTKLSLIPKTVILAENDYQNFIHQISGSRAITPDISTLHDCAFVDKASDVAREMFASVVDLIKSELSDPRTGIVIADIPESQNLHVNDNAFWGVVMAVALGSNVFTPSKDKINGTPFTAYAASYEKSNELAEFGLPTVAPETKLGFHTDGVVSGDRVCMPRNIMLYNVVIEYGRPGCFHWVPFDLWSDKTKFMKRVGIGKRYSIKLTPSIYDLGNGKLEIASPDKVHVPIFLDDEHNRFPLYINGTVVGSENDEPFDPRLFDALKQSIAENRIRYSVPQKSRRMIFARNTAGAHARDIFEDPVPNTPYTRIFLRSVDMDTISLNR